MRRHGNNLISYDQFKIDIEARFCDKHSDFDLKNSLNNRKQKSREDFRKFFNDVLSIFSRLRRPSLSDDSLMEILIRNMRPGLHLALEDQGFESINALVKKCLSLESFWLRIDYNPEAFLNIRIGVDEVQMLSNCPTSSKSDGV